LTQDRSTLTARIRYGLLVFAVSVTSGYGFFYGYYINRVNRGFSGKSDIIGYPAFGNYNHEALLYGYVLGLLAAAGTSLILIRYVELEQVEDFLPRLPPLVLVSVVIAFAVVLNSHGSWYGWATFAFVTLTLCRVAAHGIDAYRAGHGKPARAECGFSILLAVTVPLLLFHISQHTGWQTSSGIVHTRWFPVPVLIAAELLVVAFGIKCLRRADGARFFDRHLVRFILVPALIYLFTASLPGVRVLGSDFHGGERLVPLTLGLRGALPWRDFLFVHGVWDDFLQLYLGARLWEPTLRAGAAAVPLLFGPIYWVCFYLLFLMVCDFSLLAALTAFFLLISLIFDPFRFVLFPVVLLCLYFALRSKGTLLHVAFVVLCGIQVLLAPEFGLLAFCFGCAIILRDLIERDPADHWARQLRLTWVCGATTTIFTIGAIWLLSLWGLLEGFLITIVQFSRGHLQTGGIPVQPFEHLLWVTGLPLLFVAGSTLVFAQALRSSRRAPAVLWLLWGLALGTALYYPKYIGRPDLHIYQVIAVAAPGMALLTVHLAQRAISGLLANRHPWVVTTAWSFGLSLVVVFGVPGVPSPNWYQYTLDRASTFRSRFIATTSPSDALALIASPPGMAAKATALRQFFDARLHPGDAVFDFSDSPTLFYAVLQLKPASRFIHVSMAIQEEAQREVLKDLEKSRPPYVVYQSEEGLNGWDGIPNEVRHHVVARYINLRYVYDRTIEGSVIFRRADLPGQPLNDGGAANLSVCQLGYTPNVFSPRTQPHDRENALAAKPGPAASAYLQLDGWAALPAGDTLPEVVVSWNGTVLDRFQPSLVRPDVDKALGRTHGPTGFSRRIALPDPAITADEIDITAGNAVTGSFRHFGDGPVRGYIDSSTITVLSAVSLLSPRGERPAYLALQFTGSATTEAQEFFITSPQPDAGRIGFMKIGRNNELMLPLGGCYAWGAISKSVPQVSSSKPFAVTSALYYYE